MRKPSKIPAILRTLLAVVCLVLAAALPLHAEESPVADQPRAAAPENGLHGSLAQAKQAVEAEPSSAEAHIRLGTLLLEKGSLEEAGKAFDDALDLKPRSHEAMTGKGIVLARQGQDQAAEEIFKKALLLNPNPVRVYYQLGLLYEKKGDFDQAISVYKKGIEKFKQGRK
ncbi:MAG: tetratricopeptide repeat protein [Deltaproteobacteria bacterium]